jgi:predicted ATPase
MVDNAKSEKARLDEVKKQLLKTARMYAMCRKAEVAEPLDVAALALAAFEEMNMKQAVVFVQSNEQNIKDLAWAFENSNSPEEFEQRLKARAPVALDGCYLTGGRK